MFIFKKGNVEHGSDVAYWNWGQFPKTREEQQMEEKAAIQKVCYRKVFCRQSLIDLFFQVVTVNNTQSSTFSGYASGIFV